MWREIRKKDRKSFVSSENSRTFAPAKRETPFRVKQKGKSSLKDLHRQK